MNNIELAEAILKFVSDHKISHFFDIRDEFAVRGGYNSMDVKVAIDELLEKEFLILMQAYKKSVRVTDKGEKALLLGFSAYDDFIEQIKAEERKRNWIRDIVIALIGAFFGSIVPLLLS